MKLALVIMFTNELGFLRLHVDPSSKEFDGIVAITDPRTTDGSLAYMRSIGADVLIADWRYHWGSFATQAVQYAEQLGYDAICRLDPDECLMPDAGLHIRRLLTYEATLLVLPRYEFFGDRLHYRADMYPDGQARCWRLNRGIIVQGRRHEGVDFTAHDLYEGHADPDHRVLRPKEPTIYHYGWIGKEGIWRNQVKYQRHAQVEVGGPEHVALPSDTPLVQQPTVEFVGPQPLDPNVVGIYSPFGE